MQQQLNEALPLLSAQLNLPPAIDRVMARATAKSPEKRYPDVPHFLTALKRSLADHPLVVVAAEPKTPDESGAVSMPVLENPFKGLRPFAEADAAHFLAEMRWCRRYWPVWAKKIDRPERHAESRPFFGSGRP